jgi:hypothetical protein
MNDITMTPTRTGKQQQNFCRLKIQSVTQFPIVEAQSHESFYESNFESECEDVEESKEGMMGRIIVIVVSVRYVKCTLEGCVAI